MSVDPHASLTITAFAWVPPFAQGQIRDLRPRWACEEIGAILLHIAQKVRGWYPPSRRRALDAQLATFKAHTSKKF